MMTLSRFSRCRVLRSDFFLSLLLQVLWGCAICPRLCRLALLLPGDTMGNQTPIPQSLSYPASFIQVCHYRKQLVAKPSAALLTTLTIKDMSLILV